MNLRAVLPHLVLSLSLVSFSFPVYAEADGPDYWQVRNVEKNDVLNMRNKPDFKADKTGEIPFDASCVRNIGCKGGLTLNEFTTLSEIEKQQILKQRPRWCRVRYKEVTGWVAGRYLKEGVCSESSKHDMKAQGVDPYNHSYSVEKEKVTLRNGHSRVRIPGTTAVIITEVIHKPVYADLDGDNGREAVSILMQHTGGTGSFYYLAAAGEGRNTVESYFLGDRVQIVSLKIVENLIEVEYYDRVLDQSMASKPTLKISKKFKLDGKNIVLNLK